MIGYSAKISALLGVFGSKHYCQDVLSASLLSQTTEKLPLSLEEAWSMHTVEDGQTLPELNDWLKDEAEALERMKKPRTEDSNPSAHIIKTKTGTKIFASISSIQTPSMGVKAENSPTSCFACKEEHPLWRCPVFPEKTPDQRTKPVDENKLHFLYLTWQRSFHNNPKPRRCSK